MFDSCTNCIFYDNLQQLLFIYNLLELVENEREKEENVVFVNGGYKM